MPILETLTFSGSKVDQAAPTDDGLCHWNEINFLKLLYFLWQDQSRPPQLARIFIHLLNQSEPLSLVVLHKNPSLRNKYALPSGPAHNVGVPAYLVLTVKDPVNNPSIQSLFPTTETANPLASIIRVDESKYLLHRPMDWSLTNITETYQKQNGANTALLRGIATELHVTSPEQAFISLATQLRERLLGIENGTTPT